MSKITYIDEVNIKNKTILLRVDFNVSLTDDKLSIADDARIQEALPTINFLKKNKNKLILISHLGRPKERDQKLSLKIVADRLQQYLPDWQIILINDFLNPQDEIKIKNQKENEILILENIRFYPQEKNADFQFAKKLADLAQVYVNDAFGVCHRTDASVVVIPNFLPSFAGLLLKKEIKMISQIIKNPKKPLAAIIGGAKISTKIHFLEKLMEMSDYLLLAGGLANTFFCAQGIAIGDSFCEYSELDNARRLLFLAKQKKTTIILPTDVITGKKDDKENGGQLKKVSQLQTGDCILDIGPETQAKFGSIINQAKTIIWNGPVGFIENPQFRRGTDFIYYSITQNSQAISLVGGGDTLAAISKKEYLDKITHISTGGGAMLEFIEKGTLPGIEALKK